MSFIDNYRRLKEMEPKLLKFMKEKFGINLFPRYGFSNLIKIYRNYPPRNKYGIILFGRANHNGAFSNEGPYLTKSINNLLDNGYLPIIIESETKTEYLKILLRFEDEFREKPSFILIFAHGSSSKFMLGEPAGNDNNNKFVTIDDLGSPATQKMKEKYYERKLPFGFISCSTGARCGIAQGFSSIFESYVTALDQPTSLYSINSHFDQYYNLTGFDIKYHRGKKKRYFEGRDLDLYNSFDTSIMTTGN